MKKIKERMKGFVVGFVAAGILSAATAAFATESTSLEVIHGVNVMVNGRVVEFDENVRPFIADGNTFLPVRDLGNALGLQVGWNPETSTVYLNSSVVNADILLGRWQVMTVEDIFGGFSFVEEVDGSYMEFMANGTVFLIDFEGREEARWNVEGGVLHLSFDHGHMPEYSSSMTAELRGGHLILTAEDTELGITMVLTLRR